MSGIGSIVGILILLLIVGAVLGAIFSTLKAGAENWGVIVFIIIALMFWAWIESGS